MQISRKIVVTGKVQGVGFRPFIARTAGMLNISGTVRNERIGVVIKTSSLESDFVNFVSEIKNHSLPGCSIYSLKTYPVSPREYSGFKIIRSEEIDQRRTFSGVADTSVCPSCVGDFKNGRREGYLFTSCASCGPRFSIIQEMPFDRENTSMGIFPLCPECESEYRNADDRRFHAQTISCKTCGPQIKVYDKNFSIANTEDPCRFMAEKISEGCVVAVKSTGGFHLVCKASDSAAVARIRKIKNRPDKPFAVMFPGIPEIEKHASLSENEIQLLCSPAKPVVLINDSGALPLAPEVSKGRKKTGVFLPDSLLYSGILETLKQPVVATSFNVTGEPLVIDEEIIRENSFKVDYILTHNRKIFTRVDDSVAAFSGSSNIVIRKAKGLGPDILNLPGTLPSRILAVGANQKSSICLGMNEQAWVGPHLGNIDSLAYEKAYDEMCHSFLKLNRFEPETIVCDYHPGYYTTRFAEYFSANHETGLKKVYHHHAHANSLMVEHDIPVNDFLFTAVWDGTGLGPDGTIWGGEFLENRYQDFNRKHHLKTFRMLSGEKSVKEPWRVAASLLFHLYGESAFARCPWVWKNFSDGQELLYQMWNNPRYYVESSSAGRLFEGVASLLDLRHFNGYEAQAAMDLEDHFDENYSNLIELKDDSGVIDYYPLLEALLQCSDRHEAASLFINSMAKMLVNLGSQYDHLGLTGGVFQNAALLTRVEEYARQAKVKLYLHENIPCNDGGIALGQLASVLI